MNIHQWKDNEFGYCCDLVAFCGDDKVGRSISAVASYLECQGLTALREKQYEIGARLLGAMAYLVSRTSTPDARRWQEAERVIRDL